MVVLLSGWAVGLLVIGTAVRLPGEDGLWARWRRLWGRFWGRVAPFFYPRRRGPTDPTWLSGWVGMIAAGALIIGVAAAARGNGQGTNEGALIAGLAIGALGVVGILGCCGLAAVRLFEDARSPFSVEYRPGCPDCVEDVNPRWGPSKQFRLHVVNKSRVGVQRVRAYMRVVEGQGRDHFLHVQHDNDGSGLRQLSRTGEYLTVQQPVHFDVALIKLGIPSAIRFEYADPAISEMSQKALVQQNLPSLWRLRIEVSGWTDFRDVAPRSVEGELLVDAYGTPSFKLL
jgi:hypothetical protein